MGAYIIRRFAYMLLTLLLVSIVAFVIIQLPPGDFLTVLIIQLEEQGQSLSQERIENYRVAYGLDKPLHQQYLIWMGKILQLDFGRSFSYDKLVTDLIGERLALTVTLSLCTLIFTYLVAVPIGIYSAVNQYSFGDYFFTVIGFTGLAVPGFLLALILMYLFYRAFGVSVGGLFSTQYINAQWSLGKVWDLIKHLPIPVIIVGLSGTASLIRIMRGTLLDELAKQYVVTARAKGVPERRLLFRYPVRVAVNPIVSTLGWVLPGIFSGSVLVATVLSLPTIGPLMLQAFLAQDMYLAASIFMILTFLTVIGTLVSDLLLVVVDPINPVREGNLLVMAQQSERYYIASQWQLMRRKFKRHKLARIGLVVLAALYLAAIFCEFVSPFRVDHIDTAFIYCPPQRVHILDSEGKLRRPFVYDLEQRFDRDTYTRVYDEITTSIHAVRLFVRGDSYKLWGLFESDIHLFGVQDPEVPFHVLGTDDLGRDMLSRVLYAARVSLSIGLIGVSVSFFLGTLLGGVSGFYGGRIDMFIQRLIEFLMSIPTIPLWMALGAALPVEWPPLRVYFFITLILAIRGWTGLARVVRGRLISLREEDYVLAARIAGATDGHIIYRHLLPGFLSYLIVNLTLAVPYMILGETALSFLGLGLRPPVVSWGVLLRAAQTSQTVILFPWIMIPGVFVVIAVLMFNLLGDGLRDAADPYK